MCAIHCLRCAFTARPPLHNAYRSANLACFEWHKPPLHFAQHAFAFFLSLAIVRNCSAYLTIFSSPLKFAIVCCRPLNIISLVIIILQLLGSYDFGRRRLRHHGKG